MSFTDLRAARRAKESKSYVTPGPLTSNIPSTSISAKTASPPEAVPLGGSLYRSLPPTTVVRSSITSGRGIWTKEYCKPGSVLFSVNPHVAVLSNQYLDSYCSSCFDPASISGLKRCTQCRTTWYCGSTCQNKDWVFHKHECPLLQKWADSAPSPDHAVPSDAIRSLGRILWKRRKAGPESVWAREIDMMQSNRSSPQPSTFELHTYLAHSLMRYLGVSSPVELAEFGVPSAGELVDVVSRFTTNTFTISSPSLTPLGVSVSPLIALINHSCDPNVVIVFPRSPSTPSAQEPLMQVVVLRPIGPNEEILTSYIDTTLAKPLRQKALQETYDFLCHCQLCSDRSEADLRESMWCPNSCGGTCRVSIEENNVSQCIKCKATVKSTDAVLDALRVGQAALEKATALQFTGAILEFAAILATEPHSTTDPAKSKQLTTNLIPILTSAGLTASTHSLLALTRLHQSLLISSLPSPPTQESLDEAIQVAIRSTTGLQAILREGHPVRGVAAAELGKLLAVDEPEPRKFTSAAESSSIYPPSGPARLNLAYQTLIRARDELLIGFGSVNGGGQIGKEVREIIVSIENELGTWKQGVRNVLQDTPGKTRH